MNISPAGVISPCRALFVVLRRSGAPGLCGRHQDLTGLHPDPPQRGTVSVA